MKLTVKKSTKLYYTLFHLISQYIVTHLMSICCVREVVTIMLILAF